MQDLYPRLVMAEYLHVDLQIGFPLISLLPCGELRTFECPLVDGLEMVGGLCDRKRCWHEHLWPCLCCGIFRNVLPPERNLIELELQVLAFERTRLLACSQDSFVQGVRAAAWIRLGQVRDLHLALGLHQVPLQLLDQLLIMHGRQLQVLILFPIERLKSIGVLLTYYDVLFVEQASECSSFFVQLR